MSPEKQESAVVCGIEHIAVLYALFVREAYACGNAGEKAVRDATSRYGRERGARMAQKAIADGVERNRANYLLYKEWAPPRKGLMIPGPVQQKKPEFITTNVRCEWTESWKRHGLLEYGKLYCRYVDRYLCRGWAEGSAAEGFEVHITTLLSEGDDRCTFKWGYEMTPELEAELEAQAAVIGSRHVRDFDYHTGHLLHAMSSELTEQLGAEKGGGIRKAVLDAFTAKFGKTCVRAIMTAFTSAT
jgi:hypothetical protein